MKSERFQLTAPAASHATLKRMFVLILGWLASSAYAHTGEGAANGFLAGVLHPITGFDHLLAMIAVGI